MRDYIESLESLSRKQLVLLLARQRKRDTEGVAIVGMSCRLPGGIEDPEQFWRAMRDGRVVADEATGPPTDSLGVPRWNVAAPDLAPIADLLSHGGYLTDVDLFDADYFGLSGAEAQDMDPQQRLLLTGAVQALADANLTRTQLTGRRVGVFTAVSSVEYPLARLRNGLRPDELSPYLAAGSTLSATAARVAVALGLDGPTMTVDTACSSALTATHLACQALRRRECDLAIVGACHLLLSPWTTAAFARTAVLSAAGRSRPFAADADGYLRAEGCGVLVLKRLDDAMTDGEVPYASLRGGAVHQHGDRSAMSAPSGTGQRQVITDALRAADIGADQVQYVEAQANGVKLAERIEIEALAAVYPASSARTEPLYVGSCKANLGYLETASGMASLIKTALALFHGEIPPQPAIAEPDPAIAWDRIGLRVPAKPTAWPAGGRRMAGVSAFGFTGTNAHLLLEAAPPPPAVDEPPAGTPALMVLSAHNEAALRDTARKLREHHARRPDLDYAAVCRTLAVGRDLHRVRYAAVVRSEDDLRAELDRARSADHPPPGTPPRLKLDLRGLPGTALPDLPADDPRSGTDGLRHGVRKLATDLHLCPAEAPPIESTSSGDPTAGWALAWALGWIGHLRDLDVPIAGARLDGPHRDLLAAVLTERLTAAQACARWLAGGQGPAHAVAARDRDAAAGGGWQENATGSCRTVRRRDAVGDVATLPAARLDPATWLATLADQLNRGAALRLTALWSRPRHGLLRLPANVLTGRRHWPDGNSWC